jgi:hypothetical protein
MVIEGEASMSNADTKASEAVKWQAHILRVTAFPADPDSIDESSWWATLTGSEPDSQTTKKLVRTWEGPYEKAGLQLTIDAFRVQWLRHPLVDPNEELREFPNLGDFPTAAESFSKLVERWLEMAPTLKRLALGAVLHQPVEGQEAGYIRLGKYLSFPLDPTASDFNFRINRRRESSSGIEGLQINRLMVWSCFGWEMGMQFTLEGSEPRSTASATGHACRLELDINSAPEFIGPLPQDRLVRLWRELLQLATEIAAEGDKP